MINKIDFVKIMKEQINCKIISLNTVYYNYYLKGLMTWNEYYWLVYNLKGRY